MAYQNVGTPRFYVSILQWLKALGKLEIFTDSAWTVTGKNPNAIVDLNPSTQLYFSDNDAGDNKKLVRFKSTIGTFGTLMPNDNNFFMILGHENFTTNYVTTYLMKEVGGNWSWLASGSGTNYSGNTSEYNGFSIGRGNNANDANHDEIALMINDYVATYDQPFILGSILYGTYFDMPHSPDLSLTITREYGGVKTIETKGGASLSNSFYTKPPKWGDLEAWQLGDQDFSVGGRRIWDLNFSFLSDSSVFPDNPTEIEGGGWEVDDTTPDFMSEVLKYTRGSQLPFIFQPNTDDDNFAICKFDMKSFKFSQKSFNTYSISLKIREAW